MRLNLEAIFMKDNLKLIKNDGDINQARVEAINEVLKSEKCFEYISELLELISKHLSDAEISEEDIFIYQSIIKHLIECDTWVQLLIPEK